MKTRKTDSNHTQISNAFRKLGYSVRDTSMLGGGFPDLIIAKDGLNYLVEIKTEKGKLGPIQKRFQESWNAKVYIIRNIDDVVNFAIRFAACRSGGFRSTSL